MVLPNLISTLLKICSKYTIFVEAVTFLFYLHYSEFKIIYFSKIISLQFALLQLNFTKTKVYMIKYISQCEYGSKIFGSII